MTIKRQTGFSRGFNVNYFFCLQEDPDFIFSVIQFYSQSFLSQPCLTK